MEPLIVAGIRNWDVQLNLRSSQRGSDYPWQEKFAAFPSFLKHTTCQLSTKPTNGKFKITHDLQAYVWWSGVHYCQCVESWRAVFNGCCTSLIFAEMWRDQQTMYLGHASVFKMYSEELQCSIWSYLLKLEFGV